METGLRKSKFETFEGKITVNVWRNFGGNQFWFELARRRLELARVRVIGSQLNFKSFIRVKSQFENKRGSSHWEISVSCTTQECDNVVTPYYPISVLLIICQMVGYERSKSGRSRLRERVAYKSFHI